MTQLIAIKLSKTLDLIAVFNTKLFLGLLFVTIIFTYGIIFRVLRIDLLRLDKHDDTYWLTMEQLNESRLLKQY